MGVKLLIVIEGDFEGLYEFRNKAESDAFESGFGMAAGLLGSPSYDIFSREDDGEWTGEDLDYSDRRERMSKAIKCARKRGHEA